MKFYVFSIRASVFDTARNEPESADFWHIADVVIKMLILL